MHRNPPPPAPAPAPKVVLAGPYDLLTVTETVRRMHMGRSDAERWLDNRGLVRRIAGRKRVIWGDVLACIRAESPSPIDEVGPGGDRQGRGGAPEPRRRFRETTAF